MRKRLFLFLVLFSVALSAQEKKTVKWDYPVKPGSEQWQQFKSVEEMYKYCQIPDKILKQLDTETLVQICYDYPAYMALFIYNSPQDGFNAFYSNFNGIRELLNRKDVGLFMLKKYKSMSFADFNVLWKLEEQGNYVYKNKYFEILLAQPQVIQSLTLKDRKLLLQEAVKKYDIKLSNRDLFGGSALTVNAWILAKTLHADNKFFSKFSKKEDVDQSLESGILIDYDLNSIHQQAKAYATQ